VRKNINTVLISEVQFSFHSHSRRGEERFREEGETAKKTWRGGRKEAKKYGDRRTSIKREEGECSLNYNMNV